MEIKAEKGVMMEREADLSLGKRQLCKGNSVEIVFSF